MSTLRVSTIQDTAGSNSSTPSEIASGRAKAWVNFNGTGTVAIRAQYNVSSITDNGTGDYTVNFSNAMADANYAMVGTTNFRSITLTFHRDVNNGGTAPAAGSIRIRTTTDGADYDVVDASVVIFR